MSLWSLHLPLPAQIWVPLGLAALAPVLAAVLLRFSRGRHGGIAVVLALRNSMLLGAGFATLAIVATFAELRSGLTELYQRRIGDVRGLAQTISESPLGVSGTDALLGMNLFRAKDSGARFVALSVDGCQHMCLLSASAEEFDVH